MIITVKENVGIDLEIQEKAHSIMVKDMESSNMCLKTEESTKKFGIMELRHQREEFLDLKNLILKD